MKFRMQVEVQNFEKLLDMNIDGLENLPTYFEDYMSIVNEIRDIANVFVHGEFVLKPGKDPDNDDDWEIDNSKTNMIVELDTTAKTARILSLQEVIDSNGRTGEVL